MPSKPTIDQRILSAAGRITSKRPRTVVEHIIKHGFITTEELKSKYGYNHSPRAARDVREAGVPLETFRVRDSTGRSIGAYRFGDPEKIEDFKLAGRKVFSKGLKKSLLDRDGARCSLCQTVYESRYLSIDHRVPYEVAGDLDSAEQDPKHFMLLCASCQRSKSWSCEHCSNWVAEKDLATCSSCYWAEPSRHTHVAGTDIRRLDLTWIGEEVTEYDALARVAKAASNSLAEHAKEILKRATRN